LSGRGVLHAQRKDSQVRDCKEDEQVMVGGLHRNL